MTDLKSVSAAVEIDFRSLLDRSIEKGSSRPGTFLIDQGAQLARSNRKRGQIPNDTSIQPCD
jgi:hypothetical protein